MKKVLLITAIIAVSSFAHHGTGKKILDEHRSAYFEIIKFMDCHDKNYIGTYERKNATKNEILVISQFEGVAEYYLDENLSFYVKNGKYGRNYLNDKLQIFFKCSSAQSALAKFFAANFPISK